MIFFSDDRLRAMYRGGRGDPAARAMSRWWVMVIRLGLMPRRWVILEVAGCRTGATRRFPLGMADWQGQWYLVPMLGGQCQWVRNVRAAGGRATLRRRRARRCQLTEVPVSERAPILRRYLEKVPGARPHIPVSRAAPLGQFEAIAPRYPVFRVEALDRPAHRKHHWWRWVTGGVIVIAALAVLGIGLVIKLQPAPAPLALPTGAAAAPAGPLRGSWTAGAGSEAGFRVRESAVGFSNDVAGRTDRVTGTLVIAGDRVTRAAFRVDLATVRADGKAEPQFTRSLGTRQDPVAMITLARPVTLGSAFIRGARVTVTTAGQLAMHQASRAVTITLSARRDGSALQAAGSIPVPFSRWGITGPQGFGVLGSLANHGVAEFLLILHHTPAAP